MCIVKSIDDIKTIVLGQPVKVCVKSLNLSPEQLFVLIRNLGLHSDDVQLDFSEFENSVAVLEKWIEEYMQSNIEVQLQTLDIALADRISDYLKYWKLDNGILTYDGQYREFAETHWALLSELSQFISSSLYYAEALLTKNVENFRQQNNILLSVSEFKQNGMNLFNQIKKIEVDLVVKKYKIHQYLWFNDNKYQKNFLNLARQSIYVLLRYGQSTPQWKLFQQFMSQM